MEPDPIFVRNGRILIAAGVTSAIERHLHTRILISIWASISHFEWPVPWSSSCGDRAAKISSAPPSTSRVHPKSVSLSCRSGLSKIWPEPLSIHLASRVGMSVRNFLRTPFDTRAVASPSFRSTNKENPPHLLFRGFGRGTAFTARATRLTRIDGGTCGSTASHSSMYLSRDSRVMTWPRPIRIAFSLPWEQKKGLARPRRHNTFGLESKGSCCNLPLQTFSAPFQNGWRRMGRDDVECCEKRIEVGL